MEDGRERRRRHDVHQPDGPPYEVGAITDLATTGAEGAGIRGDSTSTLISLRLRASVSRMCEERCSETKTGNRVDRLTPATRRATRPRFTSRSPSQGDRVRPQPGSGRAELAVISTARHPPGGGDGDGQAPAALGAEAWGVEGAPAAGTLRAGLAAAGAVHGCRSAQMAALRAPTGMRKSESIWRSSSAERPRVVR